MVEIEASAVRPRSTVVPRDRFSLIDLLRFVAATAVVAYHFIAFPDPLLGTPASEGAPAAFWVTKYGAFGVDLFFVISGFVILMSGWGRTPTQFIASRISRLYPAYWFGVLVTAATLLVTGTTLDPAKVLVNLTMFQSAFNIGNVDPVYWTLWIELHFYVLVGVLLAFRPSARVLMLFAAAWPIVGSLAAITGAKFVSTSLIAPHAALFAGGMMIFLIYRTGHSLIAWLVLVLDVAGACVVSGPNLAGSIEQNTGAGISTATTTIVIVLCFGSVAAAALTPLRHIQWRWLFFAGTVTYPVYLLHQVLGVRVIHAFTPALGRTAASIITYVGVVGLALLVYFFIERRLAPVLRARVNAEIERLSSARSARAARTPTSSEMSGPGVGLHRTD